MFHEFFLDIYNRTFLLATAKTSEEINSYLLETYGAHCEHDWVDSLGCTDKVVGKDLSVIVIYIYDPNDYGTIAHEADHAANFVCKHCGIKLDIENDEPHTYLVGWIVKQIVGALHGNNAK